MAEKNVTIRTLFMLAIIGAFGIGYGIGYMQEKNQHYHERLRIIEQLYKHIIQCRNSCLPMVPQEGR